MKSIFKVSNTGLGGYYECVVEDVANQSIEVSIGDKEELPVYNVVLSYKDLQRLIAVLQMFAAVHTLERASP